MYIYVFNFLLNKVPVQLLRHSIENLTYLNFHFAASMS